METKWDAQTDEVKAQMTILRWEKMVDMGAQSNRTDAFERYRKDAMEDRTSPGGDTSDDLISSSSSSSPDSGTKTDERSQTESGAKRWIKLKNDVDLQFAQIRTNIRLLKETYSDKVTIFEDRKLASCNKRIKNIMTKTNNMFRDVKSTVDRVNKDLYGKDKGQKFADLDEWRLAERLVTDFTTRLKDHQQEINVIILEDKQHAKFLQGAITVGDNADNQEAASLQAAFDKFEREQLEQETNDVQEIVSAVKEIVTMVQQMSTMITKQGTIVDRIDYNLEVASARTLKGEHFFHKAERTNKKAGAMALYCIGILCVLNSVLGIVMLYKIKSESG